MSSEAEAVIHQYNFQTSRYADFRSHIESYIQTTEDENRIDPETGRPLSVTRKAFFDLKVTAGASAETIDQIIDNTLPLGDPLITQFMDQYDRLMNGGFQVPSLDEANDTEVNFVRDYSEGSNDRLIGILVRSPEAFNDPKIDIDIAKDAIRVLSLIHI